MGIISFFYKYWIVLPLKTFKNIEIKQSEVKKQYLLQTLLWICNLLMTDRLCTVLNKHKLKSLGTPDLNLLFGEFWKQLFCRYIWYFIKIINWKTLKTESVFLVAAASVLCCVWKYQNMDQAYFKVRKTPPCHSFAWAVFLCSHENRAQCLWIRCTQRVMYLTNVSTLNKLWNYVVSHFSTWSNDQSPNVYSPGTPWAWQSVMYLPPFAL